MIMSQIDPRLDSLMEMSVLYPHGPRPHGIRRRHPQLYRLSTAMT